MKALVNIFLIDAYPENKFSNMDSAVVIVSAGIRSSASAEASAVDHLFLRYSGLSFVNSLTKTIQPAMVINITSWFPASVISSSGKPSKIGASLWPIILSKSAADYRVRYSPLLLIKEQVHIHRI
jgi:hypothetical protein